MKSFALVCLSALICLFSSCAIFVYDSDGSSDNGDHGDTLIIITQHPSPVGP